MLNRLQIKEITDSWNYWERDIPAVKFGWKREKYLKKMANSLRRKEVLALTGIRRSGKSTLMYQLMSELYEKGIKKEHIFYMNFEDFRLVNDLEVNLLENLYNYYKEIINPGNFSYLFLDEVENVPYWEKWVRTYYDMGKPMKFIISGSSSKLMSSELATLLTGRNLTYQIYPFSFDEFLSGRGIEYKKTDSIEENYFSNRENRPLIKNCFNEYFIYGGFPEVAKEEIEDEKEKLLHLYLDDIIRKDVVERYGLRVIKNVFDLSGYVFSNVSQSFSVGNIASVLKLSPTTVGNLMDYMQEASLIFKSRYYSTSAKQTINRRYPQKVYTADNGFVKVASKSLSGDWGKLYENLVAQKIISDGGELRYWQKTGMTGNQSSEVDFVYFDDNQEVLPINVTFEDNIKDREKKGIVDFFSEHKFKNKNALILTDNLFSEEEVKNIKVKYCPLWTYLLA